MYSLNTLSFANKAPFHEEMLKYFILILRASGSLPIAFLKCSWFFYDVVTKCICQQLFRLGKSEINGLERLPTEFQYRLDSFVDNWLSYFMLKYMAHVEDMNIAAFSLIYFLRNLLHLMNRGFVLKLIFLVFQRFLSSEIQCLHQLVNEMLQLLCDSAHFVPLNIPLLVNKNGIVCGIDEPPKSVAKTQTKEKDGNRLFRRLMNLGAGLWSDQSEELPDCISVICEKPDLQHEFFLSTAFSTTHYIVGLLLLQLESVLSQSSEDDRDIYWQYLSVEEVYQFIDLLVLCYATFKYRGKRKIQTTVSKRIHSLPLRSADHSFSSSASVETDGSLRMPELHRTCGENSFAALQEGHLAREVGYVVLQCLKYLLRFSPVSLQDHASCIEFVERVWPLFAQMVDGYTACDLVVLVLDCLKTLFTKISLRECLSTQLDQALLSHKSAQLFVQDLLQACLYHCI
ncbi:unnamed protein product [Soboliphyme baturini]|uniref:DOCKER domain-containing protein n=1 Tax=Soboliphyme baturini TaxID=241478 RepID=A0A183IW27_9BILA|nr:unnamed protein product [Soboliphyme baturini]